MKTYRTLFLLPLVAVLSSPAMAHYNHDGYSKFDQRIERQHKRIKNGVRNAELTKKETRKLRKQHRDIKKLNRQFQKDGHLSRHERKTLQRELDLASKRIYRLKHNDRYRDSESHHHGRGKDKHSNHSQRYREHDLDRSVLLRHRDHY